MQKIIDKVLRGIRIDRDELLALLSCDNKGNTPHARCIQTGMYIQDTQTGMANTGASLTILGMLADKRCAAIHPEPYRTFIIDRNINYTNVCISRCKFCAFYRNKNDPEAYVILEEELFKKIDDTIRLGGTQILMQGGLHPHLNFRYYIDLLKSIKERFKIHIHAFSPPEIVHLSRLSNYSLRDTIRALKEAGLDSIPGGGAEILDNRCRNEISPNKCSAEEWLMVMKEAHRLGMRTTATMMFGHIESLEERLNHLESIRQLQDETGGFTAFIPWTFQPGNTELTTILPIGGHEYLKMVAISRIYMDNVKNIQASWVTQGSKVAQLALCFGANDMGSTMIEENVVAAAGISYKMDKKEIISLIESLGYQAKQRDFYYNVIA